MYEKLNVLAWYILIYRGSQGEIYNSCVAVHVFERYETSTQYKLIKVCYYKNI